MKINIARKTWAAFGYKGSGKSMLAKTIGQTYGVKCLYYDTLHEIPLEAKFHSYPPKNRQSVGELEAVIALLKANKAYRLFIIDEANRFCTPKPHPLPQGIADMNDWCRHPQFNLSVGYIARRPVQINSDLVELCDFLFIFQLGGKNDIQYLNDLRKGLGDTVLNLKPFYYCFVYPDRKWEIMSPVKADKIFIGSDTRPLHS